MLFGLVSPVDDAVDPPIVEAAMRLKCCMLTPMFMPMLEAIELDGARGRSEGLAE